MQFNQNVLEATLQTDFGTFVIGVWNLPKGQEVVFLRTKNLSKEIAPLVRIHSECLTGDVFHSRRCDCGEQKEISLKLITESQNGVFIYLRQEGRGIGLFEKIKTYILQENGYDTYEANVMIGHRPDEREYSWAKKVLEFLEIKEIRLLTNNPDKILEMQKFQINVVERVRLRIEPGEFDKKYQETKKSKFQHLL